MPERKYRLYVDEVGNPDLDSSDNPNHRFLSLTGIAIELDYVLRVVHPRMETLKKLFFSHHPDDPVIFHRKELVNAVSPFEALRNPSIREQFDNELLTLLAEWEYTVITVCIDKKKHKEQYTKWRHDPYHYCLEVLFERFVFFLEQRNAKGDVLAESRGGKEDMRLKKSFHRLWEQGTNFIDASRIQDRLTTAQLKVKTKLNNIAGLQLADILAHPSRNEILREHGLLEQQSPPFVTAVIDILQKKYYQRSGTILGHGKKLL